MFKKSRRKKFNLNSYRTKTRRRRIEGKRGLFRKRRTLPSPKIYLTTSRFRAREASGSVQRKIFLFLFLLAGGSLFYLLFFFPFWEVKEINILGNKNTAAEALEEVTWKLLKGSCFLIFPKRNLILVPTEKIGATIKENFAQIEDIKINKEFPDVLKIEIIERTPVAIWVKGAPQDLFLPPEAFASDTTSQGEVKEISGGETSPALSFYPEAAPPLQYYFLDKEGILGSEILPEKIYEQDLFLIYDQSFQKVEPREQIFTSEFLEFLFLLKDLLSLKTEIKIREFIVPRLESRDLYIKTEQGYQIFFDTRQDLQNQLNTLTTVLKEDIWKNNKEVKYYIDLRVEGMAYYK